MRVGGVPLALVYNRCFVSCGFRLFLPAVHHYHLVFYQSATTGIGIWQLQKGCSFHFFVFFFFPFLLRFASDKISWVLFMLLYYRVGLLFLLTWLDLSSCFFYCCLCVSYAVSTILLLSFGYEIPGLRLLLFVCAISNSKAFGSCFFYSTLDYVARFSTYFTCSLTFSYLYFAVCLGRSKI
jgi:hypothetical protein